MYPDIMRLTIRQLLTRPRLITLGLVMAIPPFLGFLYAFGNQTETPVRALTGICDALVLVLVLPLLALVFASAAFGNEVEDGTILYLVMKPASRPGIVLSKLLPVTVVVAALTAVSVLVTALFVGRDSETLLVGVGFMAAAAVGACAYSALFLWLGLVTSRTLIFGLLYIFLWEGVLTGVFRGIRFLSLREYARTIARVTGDINPRILDTRIDAPEALIASLAVVVIAFGLTVVRLRSMDIE